jgi:16S rRNA (guanine(966)-N(2))-methyltransferase RsmD
MPLRPTPDALRERAFAVLGDRLEGAAFLDLYAGTGAVGLEALSRGAATVVFVDFHRAAARLIATNLDGLGVTVDSARVLVKPADKAVSDLARRRRVFDLIWADPPFEAWSGGLEALARAAELGVLAAGGLACLECPRQARPGGGGGLEVIRELDGGASRLVLMARPD